MNRDVCKHFTPADLKCDKCSREELDRLWQIALHESVAAGEQYTRYRFAELVAAAIKQAEKQELTHEQIDSACLSYRHDFGLLSVAQQDYIRFQATEWAAALAKARGNK
jgi:hypothetical protein